MKTYGNLWEPMLETENIIAAIEKAAQHKKKRRDVRQVLADKEGYARTVQQMLRSHAYEPPTYKLHKIKEGSRQKEREIEKPHFKYDQIIQHCLITQLRPIIMGSLYAHAHGSLDGRGPLQTAEVISRWIRDDPKGTRYCLQLDIHRCYPSIDQENLIKRYHRKIRDADFNIENDKVIRSCPHGLALGAPTSVWHLHFLLTPFDHWAAQHPGAAHYIRHADDIIFFGPNKRKLHGVEREAIEYMRREYRLEMNHSHQVFPIEWTDRRGNTHGRPLDLCGYLFYRDRTILRERRMLGVTRKAARVARKEKPTCHDAAQMLSQYGWLDHCDVYGMYEKRVKGKAPKRKMRRIVSRHQKKLNRERRKRDAVRDSGELLCGGATAGGRDIQQNDGLSPPEHPEGAGIRGDRGALGDGGGQGQQGRLCRDEIRGIRGAGGAAGKPGCRPGGDPPGAGADPGGAGGAERGGEYFAESDGGGKLS